MNIDIMGHIEIIIVELVYIIVKLLLFFTLKRFPTLH